MIKKSYISILSKAITHYLYKEFISVLEDYLSVSRRRQTNPIAFYKLQQWMMLDLLEYQEGTNHHKERKAELNVQLKLETDTEVRKNLINDIQESNIHQLVYKIMQRNVREIVDGMVWRLFNYKRAWLGVFASTKKNTYIQLSKGLEIELSELVKYCYYGRIALLNDLSTLIDVGDVTVRNPDGKFEFHEIKGSGKNTERTLRQEEKQRKAVDFINNGYYKEADRVYRLIDLDITYDTYLKPVLNIIKEAKNKGYSSNVISKYLIVECDYIDLLNEKNSVEHVKEKSNNIRKCWDSRNMVTTLSNIHRLKSYPRLYAPYSIFPYPEDICMDLISGRAMLYAHINFSQIIEILKKNDWDVSTESSSDTFWGGQKCIFPLTVSRGEFKMPIPGSNLVRIGFEFMKMKTLLDQFDMIFQESSKKKENETWLINVPREKEVWK